MLQTLYYIFNLMKLFFVAANVRTVLTYSNELPNQVSYAMNYVIETVNGFYFPTISSIRGSEFWCYIS